jgi:hypothetical protein
MTQTPTAVLPHTLRFQSIANRIVRAMLRTPLICRLAGRRLVTVYVIGRNSGARYNNERCGDRPEAASSVPKLTLVPAPLCSRAGRRQSALGANMCASF